MKHELILIGDVHDDGAAVWALANALPDLSKAGYQTIHMEISQSDDNQPSQLIKEYEKYLLLLSIFPEGKIPTYLNEKQINVINFFKEDSNVENLKELLNLHKGRELWLKGCIEVFKKVIEYQMQLHAIDVKQPAEYVIPGGVEQRNQFMLNKIEEFLAGTTSSKGIVFAGIAHLINTWELGCYNRGLLHKLQEKENFEIRAYFPFRNEHGEGVKEAMTHLARCDENINNGIQSIKLEHLNMALNFEDVSHAIAKSISRENIQRYKILSFREEVDKQTHTYLSDLGANFIDKIEETFPGGRLTFSRYEMPSHLLTQPRREQLGIDRVRTSLLTASGIEYLEKNVPGMTIEREGERDKLLITFAKHEKSRKIIQTALKEYEIKPEAQKEELEKETTSPIKNSASNHLFFATTDTTSIKKAGTVNLTYHVAKNT